MTQPLISVIISCYNHARYVEASIRSVLDQTYPAVELLVYDDGSQDGSVEIIGRLSQQYGFFFQAQTNQGLSRTLNAGVERAHGSFIAPFGSDDIMFPDRLAKQLPWLMERPELGVAAGNVIKIDERGEPHPDKKQRHHAERTLDFDDLFLGRKAIPPTATLLFRREALLQAGGFDPEIRLEDLYILLKILEKGWKIGVMDEALAYYRVHSHNTVKDLHFMHDNVLKTYACFREHPAYPQVVHAWLNHQFLKASNRDKGFARRCLSELPLTAWNWKTLRGLWRLLTA